MDHEQEPDFDTEEQTGPRSRGKRLAQRLSLRPAHVFDYKDPQALEPFVTDRRKIMSRRISGLSARLQRQLCQAIKRARAIALLPYTRG